MEKINMFIKVLAMVTLAALLSACGTSKTTDDGFDSSSRIGNPTDPVDEVDPLSRPLAYCNQGSNNVFGANLMIYKNGDQIANDKINLKLTKIPAYFNQSLQYIQFWKWQANSKGVVDMAKDPLYFKVVDINSNIVMLDSKKILYWGDLASLASKYQVTSALELFKKVRIVVDLEDPQAEYDVIKIVMYNMDNTVVSGSNLDMLLPVFDANPSRYATEPSGSARATVLQNLHPFKSSVGQGWTSSYFQTKADEFCTPFSRID